jgi:MoaA/NifB/PqqE/SkfB family radical SAM enzyme
MNVKTFPNKNLTDFYCLVPFQTAMIDVFGNVYICGCADWLPTSVGNIYSSSIGEMLQNTISKKIRKSITDHSFIYCNENSCKILKNNELIHKKDLPKEYQNLDNWAEENDANYLTRIYFAGDRTCNLSCPSCRDDVVKYNNYKPLSNKEERDKIVALFVKNLFSSPNRRLEELVLSTSGELFASEILLDMLSKINIEYFPKCKLHIQTNGLLMQERWNRLNIWSDRVSTVCLTADSCHEITYEKLRRGGKFKKLLEVLDWFKSKKTQDNIRFIMKMVVQKDNIDQVEEFYHFAKKYKADEVHYSRITDWGSMPLEEFYETDVLSPSHKQYEKATKLMNDFKSKNFVDSKFIG